jgi:hypothetical protein
MLRIARRMTRRTVRKTVRVTVRVTASATVRTARGSGNAYVKAIDVAHDRKPCTFTRPKWASHPVSF